MVGVCAAQVSSIAPPDTAASVVSLTGQVSVMRDSNPWALQVGDHVKPGQMLFTGPDGYALFSVSDGSTFEVFPNSRVVFRDNPGNWRDLLEMLLGRVKVHVQKWGGQPNPNKVRTPTAIISVRGTTFDVSIEDGDSTLVVVEEGTVEVQHALLPRGGPRLLNQGEWLRVYKNQPLAQLTVDKGGIVQAALRAMADAILTTVSRTPRSTGPGAPPPAGGGGGGLPGDHGQKNPPSTTPAPTPGPVGDSGPGAPPPPPPPPPPGK